MRTTNINIQRIYSLPTEGICVLYMVIRKKKLKYLPSGFHTEVNWKPNPDTR